MQLCKYNLETTFISLEIIKISRRKQSQLFENKYVIGINF